ncbi:hypothetical protein GCM10007338_17790 [Corynebacterium pelargi]|nr:hypothetical protein GCM10007338_17790 [Corynebacterium pelargi]
MTRRQLAVDKHGIAKHLSYVFHGRAGLLGFDARGEHGVAEGAACGDFLRARAHCFGGTVFIDAGADGFFHKHARATCATAEALVFIARHLLKLHSRNTEELAWGIKHLVVAAQETGIVVGDRLAVFCTARHGFE